jgi:hypothetical protein
MALHQLIYMSTLSDKKESYLRSILEACMHTNKLAEVTGMLLYTDGRIMQVLEGDEVVIKALYEKIQKDKRHYDVFLLDEFPIDKRSFPDWSMGFRNISAYELSKFPHYASFFTCTPDELATRSQAGMAQQILTAFGSGSLGIS